jgi:hypothetical protein
MTNGEIVSGSKLHSTRYVAKRHYKTACWPHFYQSLPSSCISFLTGKRYAGAAALALSLQTETA